MKNSLPSLAFWIWAVCAGDAIAQPSPIDDAARAPAFGPREEGAPRAPRTPRTPQLPGSTSGRVDREPEPAATTLDQDASQLMADLVHATKSRKSISAKIRQRIDVLDQNLVGTGAYLQQGSGDAQQIRLELKIRVKDQTTSMQQVCDGRYLWLHQDLLDKTSLTRIDVARVREAIEDRRDPRARLQPTDLALCGLAKLLESLDTAFAFRIVRQDRLDGVPVWVVRGTWRPSELARLLPDPKAKPEEQGGVAAGKLPSHAPEVVVLMVGRDDLFPYRIEYRRRVVTDEKAPPTRTDVTEPILLMEWFEVALDTELDPRQFVYRPGDLDYADGTEKQLESMGLVEPAKK